MIFKTYPRSAVQLMMFTALFCLSSIAGAQSDTAMKDTSGWRFPGFFSLSFSQVALHDWAAGGQGSLAFLGTVNLNANYRTPMTLWENTLNMNYGMVKFDGSALEKNDDRLELITNYNRKFKKDLYYTALAGFRTQFNRTLVDSNVVSRFLAPAYLQLALGISYKKDEIITVFLAPVAAKFTFVNDKALSDSGSFGVKRAVIDENFRVITPGERVRKEFGAYFLLQFKNEVFKNVSVNTRVELFNNYSDPEIHNRKNIDVNWETLISLKVNEFLTTSILTHLIYDQNTPVYLNKPEDPSATGPRTQFKEVFGFGLSYKFP